MIKSDFYYEENESRIKQALLKDFKKLLQPEFTTNWESERFLIEMYLSVMRLDNLMKVISKVGSNEKKETLKQICKMISSGDISKEIYNKYLSNTPVGFMNYKELCNFFGIGDSNVKD